jgi:SWI/SNF-related matrix-associated actin-dependent regulator 1 of chromatin subfamily A
MNSKSNTETTTSIRSHDKYGDELSTLLGRLRPFQREAFDFATCGGILKERTEENGIAKSGHFDSKKGIGAGRLLLADEMGLGKTVTSLAIMLAYKSEWPLLILCPASLRYTWPAEIEKFIPSLSFSEIYVVNGFDDSDFYSNPIKRSRIKVVIATYSLLQNRSAAAQVLRQFNFQCVIADESHNLKEKTSQRCQLAMPLLMNAKRLILLSGTPALARPVELWPQLHCIDQDLFGSYTSFTKTYCNARRGRFGWDVKGLSNASELHSKLKTIMIRRLKADVLSDLPSKQRSIVPVKIQGKYIRECRDLIEEMNRNKEVRMSLEGGGNDAVFEARSLLMQAYQASGIGKAQSVAEYVLDWLRGSGSQKLLVFAHHTEVLNIIESAVSKHLKGVGHIRIDGSVPPAQRAARYVSVHSFCSQQCNNSLL